MSTPLLSTLIFGGLAALCVATLLLWYLYDQRQDRLEQERDQAARELQETIMRIAFELAHSQRDSTKAAIRAAQEHSSHLKQ